MPSVRSDLIEEIATEAYHRIGIDIEVVRLPGERALQMSNAGEVDGELYRIANIHQTYRNMLPVSVPISHFEGVVFVKHKKFAVHGWESLRPYKIGIITGVKYSEIGTNGMNRVSYPDSEELFHRLDTGRVDVVVDDRISGLAMLAHMDIKGITILEPPVTALPVYHYLHKKNKSLIPKITESLRQMEEEGKIRKIEEEVIRKLETWSSDKGR
jgi:polar amino acid transport system substrate-binding protein